MSPSAGKPISAHKQPVRVFISHSSKDSELVRLIVDFLETSELEPHEIRCTSVARRGLTLGEDVSSTLRDEIEESKIVIALLTKDALSSFNVLMELGAGWGQKKILIPVLGPRVSISNVPVWLRLPHGMMWNCRACWEQFEQILYSKLGKKIVKRRRFHRIIDKLISWQPKKEDKRTRRNEQ
ncbi:MAG TPA: toll/interleukin-1 receptor domain-containing protein [Blastocatellia bacterium]|nr:toll/interleukin-1 receptor domain-containing protein [Blastocatellia bacterium]